MGIRAITGEFYRAMKEVERLERRLAEMEPNAPDATRTREELRLAKVDRDRLKAMLEGAKD
jgi:hypothetical protein